MAQNKTPPPRAIITAGCRSNSIEEVSRGLRLASDSFSPDAYNSLLSGALSSAVYNGSTSVTQYLLSQENAPLESLTPLQVASSESLSSELLSVLVSHGWNINKRSPDRGNGPGKRLLDLICDNEALVRWCLEHGALVEDDLDTEEPNVNRPPLLESVAALGTLNTFQLLHQRGARIGSRTLHQAVGSAATSEDEERMKMVKYLVDDLGLDVNQMDTEGQLPDHWGTPLCYAAKWRQGGRKVVKFLLERGADPTIKDCWGNHDAFSLAQFYKNEEVEQVLTEWREQKQGG